MIYIYTLADPITNEIRYIGKTNNIKNRIKSHISDSKKCGSHKNNWINYLTKLKLKPIIEIIEEVNKENWEFWEKYWISQFKTWGFYLTNTTDGGENPPINTGHSEETKRKISDKNKEFYKKNKHHRKGASNSKEHIAKILETKTKKPLVFTEEIRKNMSIAHLKSGNKPCIQFSMSGELIREWETIQEAYSTYKDKHIVDVCNGVRNSASGFRWAYKGDKLPEIKRSKNLRVVIQYSTEGVLIKEFYSAIEAFRELNISSSSIYMACSGANKTAGGFIWKYK